MCDDNDRAHNWQRDVALFFVLLILIFGVTRIRNMLRAFDCDVLRSFYRDSAEVVHLLPSWCATLVCLLMLVFFSLAYISPCRLSINGGKHDLCLLAGQALLIFGAHACSTHAHLDDYSVIVMITHVLLMQARTDEPSDGICGDDLSPLKSLDCEHMSFLAFCLCIIGAAHLVVRVRRDRSVTLYSEQNETDEHAYTVLLLLLLAQFCCACGAWLSPCCHARDSDVVNHFMLISRIFYACQDGMTILGARWLHRSPI
ncbi:hypothetical protein CYMTET_40949 [Cymbomonas tetramitiformis]|uniref:Uncharacterized protein n=1 Tax=Cymbomonas tetramitiformis TaxID=36881 RepID=A0AAE0F329_9CHLO|nr:hypothetical protein CYMTET_40949 [Cymbomonas tetramitiformis]|eukprot:gene244-429_t